jgi:hypothetical protein
MLSILLMIIEGVPKLLTYFFWEYHPNPRNPLGNLHLFPSTFKAVDETHG